MFGAFKNYESTLIYHHFTEIKKNVTLNYPNTPRGTANHYIVFFSELKKYYAVFNKNKVMISKCSVVFQSTIFRFTQQKKLRKFKTVIFYLS